MGQIRVALAKMRHGDSLMMPNEPRNFYNTARKIGVQFKTQKENGVGWKVTKL